MQKLLVVYTKPPAAGTKLKPSKNQAKMSQIKLLFLYYGTIRNQAGTKPEPSQNVANHTIFALWNHQEPRGTTPGTTPDPYRTYAKRIILDRAPSPFYIIK